MLGNSSINVLDDQDFLRKILPSRGLYCCWELETKRHYWFDTIDGLKERVAAISAAGKNAYHACSSFNDKHRKAERVEAVRSLWVDIDTGPLHSKPSRYPDDRSALVEVFGWCKSNGMPIPVIVQSGHGLHCYWPIERDLSLDEWKPIAEAFKRSISASIDIDPVRTCDAASVLRPVGTVNRKNGTPVPVRLVNGEVHPLALDLVRSKFQVLPVGLPPAGGPMIFDLGKMKSSDPRPPSFAAEIVKQCGQLARMRDLKGVMSEPEWYRCLGVLAQCEDGEKYAHEWSSGYPGYTPSETAGKLMHARGAGPTLCTTFGENAPAACAACPHRGRVKSPIQLGRVDANGEIVLPSKTVHSTIDECVDAINERIGMVFTGAGFWDFEKKQNIDRRTAADRMAPHCMWTEGKAPKRVAAFDLWLQSPKRKEYPGVSYAPGQGAVLPDGFVNSWKGHTVGPLDPNAIYPEPAMWNKLLDHTSGVTENPNSSAAKQRRKVLDQFFAHMIRYPGKKIRWGMFIYSENKRTGKSLPCEIIGELIGGDNYRPLKTSDLEGKFNTFALDNEYVLGSDLHLADRKKSTEALKSFNTDNRIAAEGKGTNTVSCKNITNIIVTANSADSLTIDETDPRWYPFAASGVTLPVEFAEELWRYYVTTKEGMEELYHHYKFKVDLTGFNPNACPVSPDKAEAVAASRGVMMRRLFALIDNGGTADPAWTLGPGMRDRNMPTGPLWSLEDLHNVTGLSEVMIGRKLRELKVPCKRLQAIPYRPTVYALGDPNEWENRDVLDWVMEFTRTHNPLGDQSRFNPQPVGYPPKMVTKNGKEVTNA